MPLPALQPVDTVQMFRCQLARVAVLANDPTLATLAASRAHSSRPLVADDVRAAQAAVQVILEKRPALALEEDMPWGALPFFLSDELRDQFAWTGLLAIPPPPAVETLQQYHQHLTIAFATIAKQEGVEDTCGIDEKVPGGSPGSARRKIWIGAIVGAGLIATAVGVAVVLRRTATPSRTRRA
jgi:hypothetical protein